jgi:hypothetical protein
VPTPKKPDNTEYEQSLTSREKEMYDLYTQIQNDRDEAGLLRAVRDGELKPTAANKEGQTPLMFAVDSMFSSATVSELIDLGCDINS